MNETSSDNIGILGLGQMGGSLAMALKTGRHFRSVWGYDIKRSLVKHAEDDGIIDKAADSAADLIGRTQVVVLAVPVNAIVKILERYRETLSFRLLVADLGSVRGTIQRVSSRLRMRNHVGVHPICGTALRGRAAWNGGLYRGASCFLFSNRFTDDNSVRQAERLVRSVGGRSVTIDYRQHDYAFAVTSGLPHVLAFSLMRVRTDSRNIPIELEGPSFAGATRVSSSDPATTGEMLYGNRHHLLKAISRLETHMNRIRELLLYGDSKKLAKTLESYGRTN